MVGSKSSSMQHDAKFIVQLPLHAEHLHLKSQEMKKYTTADPCWWSQEAGTNEQHSFSAEKKNETTNESQQPQLVLPPKKVPKKIKNIQQQVFAGGHPPNY
jgi:hypothetical protein